MTNFLAAFALLATVAVPAVAKDAAPKRTFPRDGQTYVYTATAKGDATVLSGRAYPSGGAFELTVRGSHVNGRSNGVPVSFDVATPLIGGGSEVASCCSALRHPKCCRHPEAGQDP